jgi:hypothetical protein
MMNSMKILESLRPHSLPPEVRYLALGKVFGMVYLHEKAMAL